MELELGMDHLFLQEKQHMSSSGLVWFDFSLLQHCLLLMSRTHLSSTSVSSLSLGAAALRSPTTAFPAAARALLCSQTLGIRS